MAWHSLSNSFGQNSTSSAPASNIPMTSTLNPRTLCLVLLIWSTMVGGLMADVRPEAPFSLEPEQLAIRELPSALEQEPMRELVRDAIDLHETIFVLKKNNRDARNEHSAELAKMVSRDAREAAQEIFREEQRDRHDELREALEDLYYELRSMNSTGNRRLPD